MVYLSHADEVLIEEDFDNDIWDKRLFEDVPMNEDQSFYILIFFSTII